MKKISKKLFLVDVSIEVELLKIHATEEERQRLDEKDFNPDSVFYCIYGLLAGNCKTRRAKELMDLCCKRIMNLEKYQLQEKPLRGSVYQDKIFQVNGEYTGETWKDETRNGYYRDFTYISVLEGYIFLKDAKSAHIIQYLRGEVPTLKL